MDGTMPYSLKGMEKYGWSNALFPKRKGTIVDGTMPYSLKGKEQ